MKIKMMTALDLKFIGDEMEKQILPAKLAYKLSKLFTAAKEHGQFYANEISKLAVEYGEKDKDGNPIISEKEGDGIKIQTQYVELVHTKITAILNLAVDFPDITFTLDELEPLQLSVKDFNVFLPFIKEE
jgi:hypothetical protein